MGGFLGLLAGAVSLEAGAGCIGIAATGAALPLAVIVGILGVTAVAVAKACNSNDKGGTAA